MTRRVCSILLLCRGHDQTGQKCGCSDSRGHIAVLQAPERDWRGWALCVHEQVCFQIPSGEAALAAYRITAPILLQNRQETPTFVNFKSRIKKVGFTLFSCPAKRRIPARGCLDPFCAFPIYFHPKSTWQQPPNSKTAGSDSVSGHLPTTFYYCICTKHPVARAASLFAGYSCAVTVPT